MVYVCDLGAGHRIYLDNPGEQTCVTSVLSAPGQQQQSSQQFHTGVWLHPPEVFKTADGIVIKLATESQAEVLLQIQGQTIQMTQRSVGLQQAQSIQMTSVDAMPDMGNAMQPLPPMKPMSPMEPMKMGEMKMSLNPMQMQMGEMKMQMGQNPQTASKPVSEKPKAQRRFCTQCGQPVELDDRFCAACGHSLTR